MAWRKPHIAKALLGLALIFTGAAIAPEAPRATITHVFNAKAKVNPDAPAFDAAVWNDASDDAIDTFYSTHQKQLARIVAVEKQKMYIWPLAQVLYKYDDRQMEKRYGLTAAEAVEFRAAFDATTAGRQLRNNCYSYAIDHPGNPPGWKLSPGEKAGRGVATPSEFNAKTLTRLVEADGLAPAGNTPVPRQGYYLIAMYVSPGDDFHFVRQDAGGGWSHKPGDEEVTKVDFKDKLITDPRKASLGDYQFVSYFYVPKGGLVFTHPEHAPVKKPAPRHKR